MSVSVPAREVRQAEAWPWVDAAAAAPSAAETAAGATVTVAAVSAAMIAILRYGPVFMTAPPLSTGVQRGSCNSPPYCLLT